MMGRVGIGGAAALGGMALSGISSAMEPGAGADAVGVLGQTVSYAGMGAMMGGPWGAAIGGLVGLGMGLINMNKEEAERRKNEEAVKKEAEKKTQDLLEQLAVRPISLNVNSDTIGKWNTYSSQNGSNPKLA